MSVTKSISQLIDKYGSSITVTKNGDTIKTKGFVQPLRYMRNMYKDRQYSVSGFTDGRYYLYIGKPDFDFLRSDSVMLTFCGVEYVVHTSEFFAVSDKPIYMWAVMTVKKPSREDDYDTD